MSVTKGLILLIYVWLHQSWHLNQIFSGSPSSLSLLAPALSLKQTSVYFLSHRFAFSGYDIQMELHNIWSSMSSFSCSLGRSLLGSDHFWDSPRELVGQSTGWTSAHLDSVYDQLAPQPQILLNSTEKETTELDPFPYSFKEDFWWLWFLLLWLLLQS